MLQLLSTRASTSPPGGNSCLPWGLASWRWRIFSVAIAGLEILRPHPPFRAVSFLLFFVGIQHIRLVCIYTIITILSLRPEKLTYQKKKLKKWWEFCWKLGSKMIFCFQTVSPVGSLFFFGSTFVSIIFRGGASNQRTETPSHWPHPRSVTSGVSPFSICRAFRKKWLQIWWALKNHEYP